MEDKNTTPDVQVKNSDSLPELLGVIRDTVKNLSDSQAETKEKTAKMEVDLKEKLDVIEGKQNQMETSLGEMTEDDEVKEKAFWDVVAGSENKNVANVLGYGSGNPIDAAIYQPQAKWSKGKGFTLEGDYRVSRDVARMNDFLCMYGAHKSIQQHGFVQPDTYKSAILGSQTYDLLTYELSRDAELRKALKAMDTGTALEGGNWVPTLFSGAFIDDVRLQLKVAALFPRITIPMGTGSFDVPTQGARQEAYLIGESTSDTSTKIQARTMASTKITFTPIKHALRMLFSDEMTEDSAVAIMPLVQSELAAALANAEEIACINGATAATHFDAGVTAANDIRKSWDGLRAAVGTQTSTTAPNGNANKAATGTLWTTGDMNEVRKEMGKYGVNPSDLAWITSINGYINMLAVAEVQTMDKYGSNATILSGELAKHNGIPVVVSEHVSAGLGATGNVDGVTTTKTIGLLANRNSFWFADKGTPRSDSERDIDTQQTRVVVSRRLHFKELYTAGAGEDTCGLLFDILS